MNAAAISQASASPPTRGGGRPADVAERTWFDFPGRVSPTGLVLVMAAHAALLWAMTRAGVSVSRDPVAVLEVRMLAQSEEPRPKPIVAAPRPRPPVAEPRPVPAPVIAAPERSPAPASVVAAPAPKVEARSAETPAPALASVPAVPATRVEISAPAPTPPRYDADYLDNPKPVYPPLSRRLREEGRVVLRVRVDAAGRAEEVRTHASSGAERLDRAALAAVRRWRFVPARLGSEPVAAEALVPIVFSLKD